MEHYFTENKDLKSELRTITYTYKTNIFSFTSDNGVFSKNKIDFGSKLLVETYLKQNEREIQTILDVGCGYGFMGIILGKILESKVTLIDINKRAIHLAEKNIKSNQIKAEAFLSNIYENVQNTYDLIITNPPIRAGKKVVYEILKNAKNYLKQNGELWFVMRKDQGAKSAMKDLETEYKIDLIEKENGFYIIRGKLLT